MRPMVLVAFEALGFDPRLMRGGTASLVWNLATQYVRLGHDVTVITPAHGCQQYLRDRYGARSTGWQHRHRLPLVLDPLVWTIEHRSLKMPITTSALRMDRDGVRVYLLSDAMLDLLPESFYPSNELQGTDLAAHKPLAFQVAALHFISDLVGGQPIVVQAFEPLFTYLLPAVFSGRDDRLVVSTVAMNPPVAGTVYRPQLQRLLEEFDTHLDLADLVDPPDDEMRARMRHYLRPSYQRWEPRADGMQDEQVSYHALVTRHADLIDYVSAGQRDFTSTYADSPSERLFSGSAVAPATKAAVGKQIAGGCGLPDWWLTTDEPPVNRADVLASLGLDPQAPTFYHAARFDPNHKGQLELFRAIESVLSRGVRANFIVQCAVDAADAQIRIGHPYPQQVADRHPGRLHLDWRMLAETDLYPLAAAAHFCLFPSKFELDGFLITMGEAMALGAVPVATAQHTLSHFRHHLSVEDPQRTGFALPRSFRANDDLLTTALAAAITDAVRLHEDAPDQYQELSRRARRLARSFTWERAARRRLTAIDATLDARAIEDVTERIIRYGWFDQLSDEQLSLNRHLAGTIALERGDAVAWRRCWPDRPLPTDALFDAAYDRADMAACTAMLYDVDNDRRDKVLHRWNNTQPSPDSSDLVARYRHDAATRVELVLGTQPAPDPGSGNRYLHPLEPTGDGWFTGPLPAESVNEGAAILLLTLRSGRVCWDRCPIITGGTRPQFAVYRWGGRTDQAT